MDPDRQRKIDRILRETATLREAERTVYLDRACAGDEELRREIETRLARRSEEATVPRAQPKRIGPYRILGVLGEGGMGVVYWAEQAEPIRREVALKLIRGGHPTDQVVQRFESERQTLAIMDHPHIAKVFDAGADEEGNPYFVMELVHGVPVTTFCRMNRLSLDDRLRIMSALCYAVHHAHQKGIIHRDLKPSNALVVVVDGAPAPKVIDFGIAKAIEGPYDEGSVLTQEGQIIGTLRYMSPEQARGASAEVDVRSDVYALGVILYELITGSLPYGEDESSILAQLRAICEVPPAPLRGRSVEGRRVDLDLETIAFRALEKAPEDRYPSAAALGDDIERFRSSQPILARPPSTAYQLRKLISRNKVPSAMAALLLALIIGFGISMGFLYARSEANLERALAAESESGQVSDFLIDIFQVSDPSEALGNTITAREILDKGAARIEEELAGQPELQATMMQKIGVVYRGLGLYERADSLLEGALQKREGIPGAEEGDLPFLHTDLGMVYQLEGRYDEAESQFEEALARRRAALPPDDPLIASSLVNLAVVHETRAETDTAEQMLREAIGILERSPNADPLELAAAWNGLAEIHNVRGELAEAESLWKASLALREESLPPNHPEIARGLNSLQRVYWRQGKFAEAEPLAKRALAIWEEVLGPEHPEVAAALVNAGMILAEEEKLEEAEPLLMRALAVQEKALGPDHLNVAITLNNLGWLYQQLGQLQNAEEAYSRSLSIREAALGPDHPRVSTALNSLGEVCLAEGEYARAESYFTRSLAIREKEYGPEHAAVALLLHNLGVLRIEEERYAEAESLLARALEIRETSFGPVHYRVAETLEALTELYRAAGRDEEAVTAETRARSVRSELGG